MDRRAQEETERKIAAIEADAVRCEQLAEESWSKKETTRYLDSAYKLRRLAAQIRSGEVRA